jgi:hypothetical protein
MTVVRKVKLPTDFSPEAIRARREARYIAQGMPEGLNQFQQIAWAMERNLAELKRQGRMLDALLARAKR